MNIGTQISRAKLYQPHFCRFDDGSTCGCITLAQPDGTVKQVIEAHQNTRFFTAEEPGHGYGAYQYQVTPDLEVGTEVRYVGFVQLQ